MRRSQLFYVVCTTQEEKMQMSFISIEDRNVIGFTQTQRKFVYMWGRIFHCTTTEVGYLKEIPKNSVDKHMFQVVGTLYYYRNNRSLEAPPVPQIHNEYISLEKSYFWKLG